MSSSPTSPTRGIGCPQRLRKHPARRLAPPTLRYAYRAIRPPTDHKGDRDGIHLRAREGRRDVRRPACASHGRTDMARSRCRCSVRKRPEQDPVLVVSSSGSQYRASSDARTRIGDLRGFGRGRAGKE